MPKLLKLSPEYRRFAGKAAYPSGYRRSGGLCGRLTGRAFKPRRGQKIYRRNVYFFDVLNKYCDKKC